MTHKKRTWRVLRTGGVLAALYLTTAYVVLPLFWTSHDRQPALANLPMRTHTAQGIPGDPINVGAVGSQEALLRAFAVAGWSPADPITLRSSLAIAESVILHRADDRAPVSPLYYDGRKQDFAFEKQVGGSADRRHHVRFWRTADDHDGRPTWLASASFDIGVGLSRYTGQITHHIAPDVDAERDAVIADLSRANVVTDVREVTGSGPTFYGRNGEGDPYFTDGEVKIAVLREELAEPHSGPKVHPSPVLTERKRLLFNAYRGLARWLF